MGSYSLEQYTESLRKVFKEISDKREAHYKSRTIIEDISSDPAFFSLVLEKHLGTPGVLNSRHYPVVSMNIESNPYFELVANCWIPLPGRETDVSTKAIHHHGDLLLSTANSFGPGYEHWLFTVPQTVDPDRDLYTMKLVDRSQHALHNVAFVDSNIPHCPFYPKSLSITLALWSSKHPRKLMDSIKRMPVVTRNRNRLKNIVVKAGLSNKLKLNVINYFDFYPACDGFIGVKDRIEFARGPNSDYLRSLFHIIQSTNNEHLVSAIDDILESGDELENRDLIQELVKDLKQGTRVEGVLSKGHYGIPGSNFKADEVSQTLRVC
jgi:hypothetical protein